MTITFSLPKLHVRETGSLSPAKPVKKQDHGFKPGLAKKGRAKYDHPAMIADRLAGLSWAEIEIKYNVKSLRAGSGMTARGYVLNSQHIKTLTPAQVTKL